MYSFVVCKCKFPYSQEGEKEDNVIKTTVLRIKT